MREIKIERKPPHNMNKAVLRKRVRWNQKGLTLIELLAVIVILGIISAIAIVAIGKVISDTRDRAFVGNALALREASNFYIKQEKLSGNSTPSVITYKQLADANFISVFKDPDTGESIEPNEGTYVLVTGEVATDVCLIGEKRNLCTNENGTKNIPFEKLSSALITTNK